MAHFSITAPVISDEEYQRECDALTKEEKQEIHKDLYGGTAASDFEPETAVMRENGEALLQNCLDLIPDCNKMDYLQALEKAPELVERESPGLAFLRVENFDAWLAAERLTRYWKTRRMIFGEERAFLPMILEAGGAMQEDVQHLEKALLMALPDDHSGRKVLFIDRVKAHRGVAPRASILRCIFYMYQVICFESESAQTLGLVRVINFRNFDLYKNWDRIQTKRLLEIQNAMPVKVRASHICSGPGSGVLGLVLPLIKHFLGHRLRHRLAIHTGYCKEILQELELYGLKPENMTTIFGGAYSRAEFDAWLAERRKLEKRVRSTDCRSE